MNSAIAKCVIYTSAVTTDNSNAVPNFWKYVEWFSNIVVALFNEPWPRYELVAQVSASVPMPVRYCFCANSERFELFC